MNTRNLVSLLLFCSMFLVSCPNVFDPIDNPSGDAQLLSAARACFDKGDLACAKDNYGKITGTTDAEYAAAETAFTILEENGV
ncbi:MAG: hypothetical protein HY072_02890, partial [Deltaproteobacteria bacterium]|nr:hypothetical protein [Deltaproteobacteria bacterium]